MERHNKANNRNNLEFGDALEVFQLTPSKSGLSRPTNAFFLQHLLFVGGCRNMLMS